jgi:hypothetical protein
MKAVSKVTISVLLMGFENGQRRHPGARRGYNMKKEAAAHLQFSVLTRS